MLRYVALAFLATIGAADAAEIPIGGTFGTVAMCIIDAFTDVPSAEINYNVGGAPLARVMPGEFDLPTSSCVFQRIVSTSGNKDGLYWPSSDGDASPLGEFVARASAEGYKAGATRTPYHGYYYRILTQQGPNGPGGALDYVVKGKMIGGFALVAYPAEYGNSGVMTFLVNHSGTVYQKDLGDYTMTLVKRMMWFDPDQTWKKVSAPSP